MARKRNYDILANAAALVGAMPSAQSASLVETDAAFAASSAKLERHHSCCHGCYNCCPVWVYTEDGVVVKMEGDYDGTLSKGSICTKALNQQHLVYSPRHVLHPMRRVGMRGTNEWMAISWDEALDIVGEQMATATKKHLGRRVPVLPARRLRGPVDARRLEQPP